MSLGSTEAVIEQAANKHEDPAYTIINQHFHFLHKLLVAWNQNPFSDLEEAFAHWVMRVCHHKEPWRIVVGPFGAAACYLKALGWKAISLTQWKAPWSLLLGKSSMSDGDGIASGIDSDETQAPSTSSWLTAFPAGAAESSRDLGDGAPGPHPLMMDIGDLYVEAGKVKSALGEECAALAFSLQSLRDEVRDFKATAMNFMTEVRAEIESPVWLWMTF
eukprot:s10880_g1.t1